MVLEVWGACRTRKCAKVVAENCVQRRTSYQGV